MTDTAMVTPGDHTSGGEKMKNDIGTKMGEGVEAIPMAA
jgi:hypothetical protein